MYRRTRVSQNQGLGFLLFGIVVDKAYFLHFFVKLGGLTATAITSLLALRPVPAGSGPCELSPSDAQAFASTASLINSTCTWTLEIGPAGVFPVTAGGV
jgi:hypothetical protein